MFSESKEKLMLKRGDTQGHEGKQMGSSIGSSAVAEQRNKAAKAHTLSLC